MKNINIILFLCNWGPHAAYQQLQEVDYQIPAEIKMVRIPCTGRITKALLFKAFEMGADGVALVGCGSGTCRYGSGTQAAINNTEDTRDIIDLLGLGKDRMRLATFLPHESQPLKEFLADFCHDIQAMGKSPIIPGSIQEQNLFDESVETIVAKHDAYSCQDCGKCTSSCPLALCGKTYSPRDIVNAIIHGETLSNRIENDINACLTCGICHERCPSDVDFPEFIKDMRCNIGSNGGNGAGRQAHGGFFQSIMRAMGSPDLKPKRWNNIPENIQIDPDSKVMFFGGCSPYFDVFFKQHHHVKTMDILSDSLRLLNFFDIHPRLFNEERCCGHDLLWSGDRANFIRLAKLNVEAIRDAGIETIITSCPECYKTIEFDYKNHGLELGFNVIHLYEFLETQIDKGAVEFNYLNKKITFQDSCRLNRIENVRNFPRKLIQRLSVDKFEEMKDSDRSALCCGNCAWTGCDSYSKALQVKRLRQAHATGSDLMVTSCPKCQIHLSCAMQDPMIGDELKMEMIDLTSIIADTICWE
jgi:heterodisulfide reductase subunit D